MQIDRNCVLDPMRVIILFILLDSASPWHNARGVMDTIEVKGEPMYGGPSVDKKRNPESLSIVNKDKG